MMINIKKLIKKLRTLVAPEKPETIQEYENDYLREFRRQEVQYQIRLRRGTLPKMECEKCGTISGRWTVFRSKVYCLGCKEKHIRSRLKPAVSVCWIGEAEQIGAIGAKQPTETTNN